VLLGVNPLADNDAELGQVGVLAIDDGALGPLDGFFDVETVEVDGAPLEGSVVLFKDPVGRLVVPFVPCPVHMRRGEKTLVILVCVCAESRDRDGDAPLVFVTFIGELLGARPVTRVVCLGSCVERFVHQVAFTNRLHNPGFCVSFVSGQARNENVMSRTLFRHSTSWGSSWLFC
jgi:hypothetical protein